MKKFQYLLFDLDGTLTDSAEGIINSVLHALEKNGIHESDRKKLLAFVGPPLSDSFMKYYGASREEAEGLIEDYREYFRVKGWQENMVYPGIPEALEKLRGRGYRLLVATSKPEVFARRILTHFGLEPYFETITGSTLDGAVSEKGQVIALALRNLCRNPTDETAQESLIQAGQSASGISALMVGDRRHDVEGAKEYGLPCLGVLYGYGSAEELTKAGAAALCPSVMQLPEAVAGLERTLSCAAFPRLPS